MNVFIIGAGGYIGRVVTQHVLTAGHSVTGLARSEESWRSLRGGQPPRRVQLMALAACRRPVHPDCRVIAPVSAPRGSASWL
jgi:nucleoside-diphosphate-sugar epimerase